MVTMLKVTTRVAGGFELPRGEPIDHQQVSSASSSGCKLREISIAGSRSTELAIVHDDHEMAAVCRRFRAHQLDVVCSDQISAVTGRA